NSCWSRLESARSRLFSQHSRHSCRHATPEPYFRPERRKTSSLQSSNLESKEHCHAKSYFVVNSDQLLDFQRLLRRDRSFRWEMEGKPVPNQNRRSNDDTIRRREQVQAHLWRHWRDRNCGC